MPREILLAPGILEVGNLLHRKDNLTAPDLGSQPEAIHSSRPPLRSPSGLRHLAPETSEPCPSASDSAVAF
jgi:hypothetical protein